MTRSILLIKLTTVWIFLAAVISCQSRGPVKTGADIPDLLRQVRLDLVKAYSVGDPAIIASLYKNADALLQDARKQWEGQKEASSAQGIFLYSHILLYHAMRMEVGMANLFLQKISELREADYKKKLAQYEVMRNRHAKDNSKPALAQPVKIPPTWVENTAFALSALLEGKLRPTDQVFQQPVNSSQVHDLTLLNMLIAGDYFFLNQNWSRAEQIYRDIAERKHSLFAAVQLRLENIYFFKNLPGANKFVHILNLKHDLKRSELAWYLSDLLRVQNRLGAIASKSLLAYFTDIQATFFQGRILEVQKKGLFPFIPGTVFLPEKAVSRGDFAQTLTTLFELIARNSTLQNRFRGGTQSAFFDMKPGSAKYVAARLVTAKKWMDVSFDKFFLPEARISGFDTGKSVNLFLLSL